MADLVLVITKDAFVEKLRAYLDDHVGVAIDLLPIEECGASDAGARIRRSNGAVIACLGDPNVGEAEIDCLRTLQRHDLTSAIFSLGEHLDEDDAGYVSTSNATILDQQGLKADLIIDDLDRLYNLIQGIGTDPTLRARRDERVESDSRNEEQRRFAERVTEIEGRLQRYFSIRSLCDATAKAEIDLLHAVDASLRDVLHRLDRRAFERDLAADLAKRLDATPKDQWSVEIGSHIADLLREWRRRKIEGLLETMRAHVPDLEIKFEDTVPEPIASVVVERTADPNDTLTVAIAGGGSGVLTMSMIGLLFPPLAPIAIPVGLLTGLAAAMIRGRGMEEKVRATYVHDALVAISEDLAATFHGLPDTYRSAAAQVNALIRQKAAARIRAALDQDGTMADAEADELARELQRLRQTLSA